MTTGSSAGSALADPVASHVTSERLNRAMAGWVVEAPYDPTMGPTIDAWTDNGDWYT
jgi:hypothetical protein